MHSDAAPEPEVAGAKTNPSVSTRAAADGANGAPEPEDTHRTIVAESKTPRITDKIAAPELPDAIGGYRILGELGRGGMGVVYKAQDPALKRLVAIKMLWSGREATVDELIRFRGEAEVVAQLQHANIVQIYETGQHNGQPYLALEYVDGPSLDKVTKAEPQPPRRAAEWIEILARAVHVAHQHSIIHRDMKPANVLVASNGTLKITDFGLAKRLDQTIVYSRTGDVMGTPYYMAPEQASGHGHDAGPASDVYALGAMLYELFTGRPPFKGANVVETLEQVREAEPASPSRLVPRLHRDLSTICLKCLQKAPARRYPSADALADDLRRWLDGLNIHARPVGSAERLWRAVKRRPLVSALLALSGLMVVALVLLAIAVRENDIREAARDQQKKYEDSLHRQEEELHASIQEQRDLSLKALNDILDLVRNDERLRKQPGLEPLHQTLLHYYDGLVQRQEQDHLAQADQLADACSRLGELMWKTGNKEQALVAYGKAEKLYAPLAQGDGADSASRWGLAQTQLQQGILHYELGRLDAAEAQLDDARAGFDALCRDEPDHDKARRDLAETWHCLGMLHDARGLQRTALADYEKGRDIRLEIRKTYPDDVRNERDLARSYGYMGDVQIDLGDLAGADASYWNSHRIRERLAERVKDPETRFQLARSFSNFGNYQVRLRAFDTAIDDYEKGRKIREAVIKDAPSVTEYQTDLVHSYNRIAETRMMKGAPKDEVKPLLESSIQLLEPMRAANPTDAMGRSDMAETCTLLAELLIDDPAERRRAQQYLKEARTLLKGLCEQRPDASDLYRYAVVLALDAELHGVDHRSQVLETLRLAVKNGYRRKHPIDVENDRGFKTMRNDKDFRQFLSEYGQGPT